MKNVQVKPGKPSKFYVNNKRVCLNTAFGMYEKGAKFTTNGKKLNLNKFGVSPSAAYKIPPELVEKIRLMTYGLNPHPLAKIIKDNKKWEATQRWEEDRSDWSGQGREYIGHPGYTRRDVMNMSIDKIRSFMENIPGPYDDYSGSDSYKTRMRNTMRWSSDDDDWSARSHSGGRAMTREEVNRMNKGNRLMYMKTLPRRASFWT